MKKLFIAVAALCCTISGFAQQKGDMTVGGSITLNGGQAFYTVVEKGVKLTEKDPMNTNFGISADFGYFVIDNLKVSAALSFSVNGDTRTSNNNFGINPSVAYFVKLADRFYYTPAVYGNIGFGTTVYKKSSGEVLEKVKNTPWGIGLDLVAFEFQINSKCAIAASWASLGYSATSHKDDLLGKEINSSFHYNFGSCSLAFRYYL